MTVETLIGLNRGRNTAEIGVGLQYSSKVANGLKEANLLFQELIGVIPNIIFLSWKVVAGIVLVGGVLTDNLPASEVAAVSMIPISILHTLKRQRK